ncbi:MAG TPA: PEP/pyruvate-binding domain-containing protein [Actinomycetes bacterium]|jgi:pyruvate,water dikinase|nr:PEP/pyruvate-binding domain-containing protein [Actinomycetes bacterium]
MTFVLWLDEYDPSQRPRVGGKNAGLGEMLAAGLPVPPGFAVTIDAYRTMREHDGLRRTVRRLLGKVDVRDAAALEEISAAVRGHIEQVPLHEGVERAVRSAYDALCERCSTEAVPVAVRSSAASEDLPDASFAGEHDTFLWVRGADAVLRQLSRCWSSLFTARAVAYRRQTGNDHDVVAMSVGVQKMIHPKAAGVAFTLNPSDGDRSQVAIEAAWGFGEGVVAGEVTPDSYLVDKVLGEIVKRTVSDKQWAYQLTERDTVERVPVDPAWRTASSLDDEEVRAVARLARRAEKHYRCPQDVEWAIDRDLEAGDNVILLQTRPETVWSRRARPPVAAGTGDNLSSIVATLLSPLHQGPTPGAAGPPGRA